MEEIPTLSMLPIMIEVEIEKCEEWDPKMEKCEVEGQRCVEEIPELRVLPTMIELEIERFEEREPKKGEVEGQEGRGSQISVRKGRGHQKRRKS